MYNKSLWEMARIGFVKDLEIYVRTNDAGKVPHFHIRDKETNGQRFHTCVRMDKAEYFHHTGKMDVLNSQQKKALVSFLQSQYKRGFFSNWVHAIILWDDNNSDVEIDLDTPMPDYTKLQ